MLPARGLSLCVELVSPFLTSILRLGKQPAAADRRALGSFSPLPRHVYALGPGSLNTQDLWFPHSPFVAQRRLPPHIMRAIGSPKHNITVHEMARRKCCAPHCNRSSLSSMRSPFVVSGPLECAIMWSNVPLQWRMASLLAVATLYIHRASIA